MVGLNAKLANVSECQTKEIWWNLNAKLTNVSECQIEDMMALNAEPKKYGGSECQTVKRW